MWKYLRYDLCAREQIVFNVLEAMSTAGFRSVAVQSDDDAMLEMLVRALDGAGFVVRGFPGVLSQVLVVVFRGQVDIKTISVRSMEKFVECPNCLGEGEVWGDGDVECVLGDTRMECGWCKGRSSVAAFRWGEFWNLWKQTKGK